MPMVIQLTNAELTKLVLWSYPVIFGHGLILVESVRILPAEIRIWSRAWKRGRLNAAELLFVIIKYFAIVGYCADAVVRTTTFSKTARQCWITHYISYFFILLDTSFVASAIAWRTYIIFQCRRKVYYMLLLALLCQFTVSMVTMSRQIKVNVLIDGYCDAHYPRSVLDLPPWKLALPYHLFYNTIYDLAVTIASTRHLINSTGASCDFSEISRTLFYNNIHYVVVVCTVNLGAALALSISPRGIPNLMHICCALQIITVLNLLSIEQDLVHRPTTNKFSHAPSSALQSNPSSPSLGKEDHSTKSWQINSKETSTLQSDSGICTSGSPILHSLWNKKASTRDGTKQQQAPGITYEQKKMHYYDDVMTDVEKLDYNQAWAMLGDGSRNQRQVVCSRPEASPRAFQSYSPKSVDHPVDALLLATPTRSLRREDSDGSFRVHFNQDLSVKERSDARQRGTPIKSASTSSPLSIRSIRANLDQAAASVQESNLHRSDSNSTLSFSPRSSELGRIILDVQQGHGMSLSLAGQPLAQGNGSREDDTVDPIFEIRAASTAFAPAVVDDAFYGSNSQYTAQWSPVSNASTATTRPPTQKSGTTKLRRPMNTPPLPLEFGRSQNSSSQHHAVPSPDRSQTTTGKRSKSSSSSSYSSGPILDLPTSNDTNSAEHDVGHTSITFG